MVGKLLLLAPWGKKLTRSAFARLEMKPNRTLCEDLIGYLTLMRLSSQQDVNRRLVLLEHLMKLQINRDGIAAAKLDACFVIFSRLSERLHQA